MDGPRSIVSALKRISTAGRQAWVSAPAAEDAALTEYLYVPCARRVQPVPIIRKTAKWIYYTSDSWDRSAAVVSPGCISRQQFETAGVIPIPDDHRLEPGCRLFFATREAAEACLCRRERERLGRPAPPAPLVKQLRRAMADAHPDRGGTTDQFMAAHRRYQRALQADQAA